MPDTILNSQQIRKASFNAINAMSLPPWMPLVLMGGGIIPSDSKSEDFADLGTAPAVREWAGGRKAAGLDEYTLTVNNVKFEQTMRIEKDWLRFDKLMLVDQRVEERAQRWLQHWMALYFQQLIDGESTACYDGQFFFDTDHPTGKDTGTTQSNDISVDISTLPAETRGSTTAPSVEEAAGVIEAGIAQILGLNDDQGEPANEGASNFIVQTSHTLARYFRAAVAGDRAYAASGAIEALRSGDFSISVVGTPRLSTWTSKVAITCTDFARKPVILQEVGNVEETILAENSELEHREDAWEFGYLQYRGRGYGAWNTSVLCTMT